MGEGWGGDKGLLLAKVVNLYRVEVPLPSWYCGSDRQEPSLANVCVWGGGAERGREGGALKEGERERELGLHFPASWFGNLGWLSAADTFHYLFLFQVLTRLHSGFPKENILRISISLSSVSMTLSPFDVMRSTVLDALIIFCCKACQETDNGIAM